MFEITWKQPKRVAPSTSLQEHRQTHSTHVYSRCPNGLRELAHEVFGRTSQYLRVWLPTRRDRFDTGRSRQVAT